MYLIPLSKCVYREAQQYISMSRKQNIRTSVLYFMHVNKVRLLYLMRFYKLSGLYGWKLEKNLVPPKGFLFLFVLLEASRSVLVLRPHEHCLLVALKKTDAKLMVDNQLMALFLLLFP